MRKSAVWEPGAKGVNATVIVQVCACGTRRWHGGGCAAGWTASPPRRAASRRAGVRTEKSCRLGPLMLIRVIVAGELPLLVMVKDLVMLALTWTAGKTRADGWKDTPGGLPFGPLCPRLSSAVATPAAATTTAAAAAMAAALGRNRGALPVRFGQFKGSSGRSSGVGVCGWRGRPALPRSAEPHWLVPVT